MKTIIRRLQRLEAVSAVAADGRRRDTLRVVAQYMGEPATLETATCHRRIDRNGLLMEVVYLEGRSEGLTDEDLDHFVGNFPIEPPRSDISGGRRKCDEDGCQEAAQRFDLA